MSFIPERWRALVARKSLWLLAAFVLALLVALFLDAGPGPDLAAVIFTLL